MVAVPRSIKLNSIDYAIDPAKTQRASIPPLRENIVSSNEPTDSLFNAEAAWSRYRYSWHRGAGQTFDDLREDADPFRFSDSVGVDVWTQGQLTLLPGSTNERTLAGSDPQMIVSGIYVFCSDGATLYRSDDGDTWTAMTAPGGDVQGLSTDGTNLFVATTTNLVMYVGSGTSKTDFSAGPVAGNFHSVHFVGNRLFASKANVLHEVATDGTLSTVKTHYAGGSTGFRWKAVWAVGSKIYFGGYHGVRSEIYTATDVAGTLASASESTQLPLGELLYHAFAHAGVVILCTSKGVRLAQPQADATLTYGPLVEITGGCQHGVAEGRFVWVTADWDHAGTFKAGTYRLALDEFTDTLKPAYANDVYVAPGSALSSTQVARFNSSTLWAINAHGVRRAIDIAAGGTLFQTSGTVTSGRIYFGTVEPKYLASALARFADLDANDSVAVSVLSDFGVVVSGTESDEDDSELVLASSSAVSPTWFQVTVTLGGLGATSPTFQQWRMRAYPVPPGASVWQIPLLLREKVTIGNGAGEEVTLNVATQLANIEALFASRAPVTFEVGSTSYTVRVDGYRFDGETWRAEGDAMQGVCLVRLIEVG
jgi:hypothetical protein